MKKAACFFALIGCLALYSCNSTTDDQNTRAVEEKKDQAAEAAGQMEDTAEEYDTTAVKVEQ